jgi:hypothetical protein
MAGKAARLPGAAVAEPQQRQRVRLGRSVCTCLSFVPRRQRVVCRRLRERGTSGCACALLAHNIFFVAAVKRQFALSILVQSALQQRPLLPLLQARFRPG